jgi:MFS family permease
MSFKNTLPSQHDNLEAKSSGGGLPKMTVTDSNGVNEMNDIKDSSVPETSIDDPPPRNFRFWLVFISLCLTSLSTSLDATVIATALPTIVNEIGGKGHYVWIGNSFLLASTVIQPLVGQLADIFGRKNPMLISLAAFMLGSGLAGGASNVAMLIAARTIQGLGSGGIFVLLDIITCDMVPIRERGKFLGLVLSTGAIGSTLGPIIGGVVAQHNWRWVFYLTLPTSGIAVVFLVLFLRLNSKPDQEIRAGLARVDYIGFVIFVGSISSILLALIMGGTEHPWSSSKIIIPLILGFVGWGAFHLYERTSFCRNPSIPHRILAERTSAIGFILAFGSGMFLMWLVMFLPIYFQGVLQTSPLTSGVDMLPLSIFLVPSGIFAGAMMSISGRFKELHWAGFGITATGCGLLSILNRDSRKAAWASFQIISAIGTGFIMTTILPAIQASLPEVDQAKTTAFFSFMRSFGMVWGITIPSIVFNSQFDQRLHQISDAQARMDLAGGGAYGLVSEGYVQALPLNIQQEIVVIYTEALKTVWEVGVGFALFGFLLVFLERHIDLRKDLKTEYGVAHDGVKDTAEAQRETTVEGELPVAKRQNSS